MYIMTYDKEFVRRGRFTGQSSVEDGFGVLDQSWGVVEVVGCIEILTGERVNRDCEMGQKGDIGRVGERERELVRNMLCDSLN